MRRFAFTVAVLAVANRAIRRLDVLAATQHIARGLGLA